MLCFQTPPIYVCTQGWDQRPNVEETLEITWGNIEKNVELQGKSVTHNVFKKSFLV